MVCLDASENVHRYDNNNDNNDDNNSNNNNVFFSVPFSALMSSSVVDWAQSAN